MLNFDANWSTAIDAYLWPFINDIFGKCAASGYKEAYGLECLSNTFAGIV